MIGYSEELKGILPGLRKVGLDEAVVVTNSTFVKNYFCEGRIVGIFYWYLLGD